MRIDDPTVYYRWHGLQPGQPHVAWGLEWYIEGGLPEAKPETGASFSPHDLRTRPWNPIKSRIDELAADAVALTRWGELDGLLDAAPLSGSDAEAAPDRNDPLAFWFFTLFRVAWSHPRGSTLYAHRQYQTARERPAGWSPYELRRDSEGRANAYQLHAHLAAKPPADLASVESYQSELGDWERPTNAFAASAELLRLADYKPKSRMRRTSDGQWVTETEDGRVEKASLTLPRIGPVVLPRHTVGDLLESGAFNCRFIGKTDAELRDLPGFADLEAVAEADGKQLDDGWLRCARGRLFKTGIALESIDRMTVAEFAAAISRLDGGRDPSPEGGILVPNSPLTASEILPAIAALRREWQRPDGEPLLLPSIAADRVAELWVDMHLLGWQPPPEPDLAGLRRNSAFVTMLKGSPLEKRAIWERFDGALKVAERTARARLAQSQQPADPPATAAQEPAEQPPAAASKPTSEKAAGKAKGKNINGRMLDAITKAKQDNQKLAELLERSQRGWAEALGCVPSTVADAPAWGVIKEMRTTQQAARVNGR